METMKLPGAYSARQLLTMLAEALHKEKTQWKPHSYKEIQHQDEVTSTQRNEISKWISHLNLHFHFYPETYFLSVAMIDKVLRSVKVRPKYLRCIGIACFYVAAKTLEEDEMVPSTLRFVQQSGCGCSVAEVLRMERRVLDILGWNLRLVTPLNFLHILHASLLSSLPHLLDGALHMTPGKQLSLLTRKLDVITQHHSFLNFTPSVLALTVISLELQQFLPQWFTVTHIMQQHIEVSDEELIHCTEEVSRLLGQCHLTGGLLSVKSKKNCESGTPTKKRKVADSDDEDDYDIYEGIKQLYSEEPAELQSIPSVTMGTCGGEHRQEDTVGALPMSLQAVAN